MSNSIQGQKDAAKIITVKIEGDTALQKWNHALHALDHQ